MIVPQAPKSMGVATLLAFFFGPLGLLYATVKGGLIMMAVGLLIGVITVGLGLILIWPVCVVWAAMATKNHNGRLGAALS